MKDAKSRLARIEKEAGVRREDCLDTVWVVPYNLAEYKVFLEKYRQHFPCPGFRPHYICMASSDAYYERLGLTREQVEKDLDYAKRSH